MNTMGTDPASSPRVGWAGGVSERAVFHAARSMSRAVGVFITEVVAGTASTQHYEDVAHDCTELARLLTDAAPERRRQRLPVPRREEMAGDLR